MLGSDFTLSDPIDFSDMKVLLNWPTAVLVNSRMGPDYDRYIRAAHMTYCMRNKSVDHVLKTYFDTYDDNTDQADDGIETLIDEILKFSKDSIAIINNRLNSIDYKGGNMNSLACESAFIRLAATFRSIHYHIKFGYYFESMAMIRLVLEQLFYIVSASNVKNPQSHKDFLSPSKGIADFKKLLPQSGVLYGMLSKKSHIEPTEIHNFINIIDNQSYVTLNNPTFGLEACYYLLIILDCQECAFEYSFRNLLNEFSVIKISTSKIIEVRKKRKSIRTFLKYKKSISKHLIGKELLQWQ